MSTVSYRCNIGTVSSKPTRGMDVGLSFSVLVLFCLARELCVTSRSPRPKSPAKYLYTKIPKSEKPEALAALICHVLQEVCLDTTISNSFFLYYCSTKKHANLNNIRFLSTLLNANSVCMHCNLISMR
jgi:hypothetical protein